MNTTPTDAAMRAAEAVQKAPILHLGHEAQQEMIATVIDRETHLPELMDALSMAMAALLNVRDFPNHSTTYADAGLDRINAILNPQTHENTNSSSGKHHPAKAA